MTVNKWIEENYENILQWSKQLCYNHEAYMDLAHDMIDKFMCHEKAEGLVERGEARWFMTVMLKNQARSGSSPFDRNYRIRTEEPTDSLDSPNEEYNIDIDYKIESIQGVIEDLKAESIEGYYACTIFEQVLTQPKMNFSKLSKETGIPRTSISNAVEESKEYIRKQLKERGIDYDI
jgi:hypothetical protein